MSTLATTQSWALGAAGVASLAVATGRVQAYRDRAEPTRAYLAVALGALGMALLLNVVPVGRIVDEHLVHRPNTSVVTSQVLALVDAWASIEMVMASTGRLGVGSRRARAIVLVVSAVVLVFTFAMTPAWPQRPVVQFFVETSTQPAWRTYWLLFAGISFLPLMYLGWSSLRHAAQAMPWLRAGLVVVGAGSGLCATFSALLIVSVLFGSSLALGIVQMAFIAAGCTLCAAGVAIPHLPDLVSCRRLRPMWSSLTAMYPEVRTSRRPDLRRVVTEVQDAVVIARARDELASPLVCAVARLPTRPGDAFEETVADLLAVSRRKLSAEWNAEAWVRLDGLP